MPVRAASFTRQANMSQLSQLPKIVKYKIQLVRESEFPYTLSEVQYKNLSPRDAYELIEKTLRLSLEPKENFGILTLDIKVRAIGLHIISIGSIGSSVVSPRDVFAAAILNNAAAIILFHNHPSGDPTPSSEDIKVTRSLCDAGKIMGIQVLDHIIIGENRYESLKQSGYF
nr:JAB domain-containing protein [Thermanaerosceptrum fracticalcis]